MKTTLPQTSRFWGRKDAMCVVAFAARKKDRWGEKIRNQKRKGGKRKSGIPCAAQRGVPAVPRKKEWKKHKAQRGGGRTTDSATLPYLESSTEQEKKSERRRQYSRRIELCLWKQKDGKKHGISKKINVGKDSLAGRTKGGKRKNARCAS